MKPEDYIDKLLKENNFTEVIKIRSKFQKEYPEEFKEYLKKFAELNKNPWSPLCIGCINWQNNNCNKKLKPLPLPKASDKQEYYCSSWTKK